MATYRAFAIYVNGKKAGDLKDTSFKVMTNGEQIVVLDDVGESDGVVTTEGSIGTFIPVGTMKVDLFALVINQTPVDIGLGPVNGKIYKVRGKIIDGEATSTVKSGVVEGKFGFRGAKPKPTSAL